MKEELELSNPSHPCCSCDGWEESECCGALIVNHDICSDCNEHCSNRCENCPDKEVEEIN